MEVNTELPPDEVILSSLSNCFPSKQQQQSNDKMHSFSTCEEKAQAIRDCLQGNLGNENVDLWQLRQLALLPGGLLSPSLRKSAWTKLTGVSDAVWSTMMTTDGKNISGDSVAPEDAFALQRDVQKTVWRLEDVVQHSKATEGKEADSFWYAPLQQAMGSLASPSHSEPGLLATPTSCFSDNTSNTDEDSTLSQDSTSAASFHKDDNNTSKQLPPEQSTLQHVLTHVLEESHDYHYSPGLANVAALVMINVESPTLASLVLSQLASYPLHHVLSNKHTSAVDSATELLSLLVEHFHLPLNCDLHHIAKHAMTWFTSQRTPSVQMASRLVDVFMVSHPLFPLYVGVATLTHQGSLWTMDTMEDVIRTGLSFMEQLPPTELLAMANDRIDLLQTPQIPAWALAASAPTDWATLQAHQEEEHIDLPCFPLSPVSSPTRREQQQQQNHSFETTEGGSDEWERLSVVSSSELLVQPMFPELEDQPVDESPTAMATHFCDSYPLAMAAAGLAMASKSSTVASTANPRNGVFRFALFMAVIISLLGVHLQGLPLLPTTEDLTSTHQQCIDLIPTIPKAGWSHMVTADSSKTSTETTVLDAPSEVPDAEQMLYKHMFEGLKSSFNKAPEVEKAVASVNHHSRLKILQPLARQMQRLRRSAKKIASKVFRRHKKP